MLRKDKELFLELGIILAQIARERHSNLLKCMILNHILYIKDVNGQINEHEWGLQTRINKDY